MAGVGRWRIAAAITVVAADRLPTAVFVMPDLDHEMHSGPVRVAATIPAVADRSPGVA
jgi:hypothetical protein